MKTQNIYNLIKSKEIDVKEVLGIPNDIVLKTLDLTTLKKYYKKRALVLHPDKTGGKTELEFKILSVCYTYAVKYIEKYTEVYKQYYSDLKNKTFTEVTNLNTLSKSRESDDIFKQYYSESNVSIHSDWDNPEIRKQYLVDDTIEDFDTFKKGRKNFGSYSEVLNDPNFKIPKMMFKNGKFDIDKFNAVFEKLKESHKKHNEVVKYDSKNLTALHTIGDTTLTEIAGVKDVMILHKLKESKKKYSNLANYKEKGMVLDKNVLKAVSKDDIKTQKDLRLNSKKMSNKEIKEKISKIKSIDFSNEKKETEEEFLDRKTNDFINHKADSAEFLQQNIRIFPQRLQMNMQLALENKLGGIKYLK